MEFFKNFALLLTIGGIFLILGKFLKDRFIKLIGVILFILTISTSCIAFLLGFIDAFR